MHIFNKSIQGKLPSKVGSLMLSLTKVGFLMYTVRCSARYSGYVADKASICLLSGRAE